ncbi:helix-turn-helix domain-containing protein [Streptococcus fryi]
MFITSYGAAFKKLREERGLTIKATAQDIVSPQFLSKFEKEDSSISLENFNKLLIRIGVTWEDFFETYQGESIEFLIQHLHRCLTNYTNEEDILRHALEDIPYDFSLNPPLKTIVADMIKLHIGYGFDTTWDMTEEIKRVSEFLNKVDHWGKLEWMVYSLTLAHFPDKMVIYRTKEIMVSLTEDHHLGKESKEVQIQMLLDTLRYFSRSGNYEKAEWIIDYLDSELAKPQYQTYVMLHILLKLQSTHHYFRKGDMRAHELGRQVMDILTILEKQFNMPALGHGRDMFFWDVQKNNNTGKDFI